MLETYKLRSIVFHLLLIFFHSANGSSIEEVINRAEGLQTYIIHVSPNSSISTPHERERWHNSFLPSGSSNEPHRLIYSYNTVVSGFAARLTEKELVEMKKRPGFLHATPDRIVPLQTTRTPNFLGLRRDVPGFWQVSKYGGGVIIGVIDTGISPNHVSFTDVGMPPPPPKWKGVCEFNPSDCNNKLIGARDFVRGLQAMTMRGEGMVPTGPYDTNGHGTHCAGIATGVFVKGASTYGVAYGTAAGMAPSAHLAIYKVCGQNGCANSDILAGFDSAIHDGVDVVSLSIGEPSRPFYEYTNAIATFAAVEAGIFVSCSAGNRGPGASGLSNEAPWMLSVGASTLDRAIRTTVKLGNGAVYYGESFNRDHGLPLGPLTLVYPGANGGANAKECRSLPGINIRGMVVLCDAGAANSGAVVQSAGGLAVIIVNTATEGSTIRFGPSVLPASVMSYADGLAIKSYITSASTPPTASLTFEGTEIGVTPAPVVASFSSRGPNKADPNVLKPDIIAPGVMILSAWPSSVGGSPPTSSFNMISGTSMAAPHLSGIAALLKAAHPDWSPAAIKSAIMTSADLTDNTGKPITDQTTRQATFFALGAGHVNPSKAASPGLIYDLGSDDYIAYLCGLRYTDAQVSAIARRAIRCSTINPLSGSELNYPSFMVSLSAANGYTMRVTRTVTNVGLPNSRYSVTVTQPTGVSVTVEPEQLSFSATNGKAQFSVTFSTKEQRNVYSQGYLTWVSSDRRVTVNSPIMVAIRGQVAEAEGLSDSI